MQKSILNKSIVLAISIFSGSVLAADIAPYNYENSSGTAIFKSALDQVKLTSPDGSTKLADSSSSDPDLSFDGYVTDDFRVISNVTSSRKQYALEVIIVPFKNENNEVSRLESFQLNITPKPIIKLKSATSWFANSSVLGTGDWTKVAVTEAGVYK